MGGGDLNVDGNGGAAKTGGGFELWMLIPIIVGLLCCILLVAVFALVVYRRREAREQDAAYGTQLSARASHRSHRSHRSRGNTAQSNSRRGTSNSKTSDALSN